MDMAFEKETFIGTSPDSFEDATDDAISRARQREDERALYWVEVDGLSVEIATADDREYQAEVTAAYELQNET